MELVMIVAVISACIGFAWGAILTQAANEQEQKEREHDV